MMDSDGYPWNYCEASCTHGGSCTFKQGHLGPHSASGVCQWTSAESVSVEVGHDNLRAKVLGLLREVMTCPNRDLDPVLATLYNLLLVQLEK